MGQLIIYYAVTAIYFVLGVVALGLEAWAFIDALSRNHGDYEATMKRSKGFWLALTGGAALVGVLSLAGGVSPMGLFAIVAVTASCVYLADVRPAIRELRRGGYNSW
ncbi:MULTISPECIES: DUF2516 family protein [Arthrobacter]|uniref:DUF2516 family protein n=2 Tax=Arthrobacter TaxID=1663 RepID=A0ABU9KHE2_9MICC|nr:DUF2516 family protein [Arthrobacter sp. YJM1]MDP5226682.1 DUF2516 family protein [Arthrobacter sp. YJM1]